MAGIRKIPGARPAGSTVLDFASQRARAHSALEGDPADSAGFTARGRELSGALGAIAESSDIRLDRVLALRAQIRNGSYQADPREIARRLMERGF